MSESERSERLPCGVALAPLIDQVAEGAAPAEPEHQAACPHCRATVTELEEIWERVREVAHEEVVAPDRIVEHVISRIREEFVLDGIPLEAVVPRMLRHAQLPEARGSTRIADVVVEEIAARVAQAVPGVHALSAGGVGGALRPLMPSRAGVGVEVREDEVTVELRLVVEYGAPIPEVTGTVRLAVIQAVEALTGLSVPAVDISVDDVHVERAR